MSTDTGGTTARTVRVGAERVRHGYLTAAEREALAALLEATSEALSAGETVPEGIADTWRGAFAVLSQRQGPR